MSRRLSLTLPILAAFALAGCDALGSLTDTEAEGSETENGEAQTPAPSGTATAGAAETGIGAEDDATPMAERVATIGLLNKRNNVSKDLELRPGESVEEGPVIVRLEACERTAPYEFPQETGAFVQLDVLERGQNEHSRVFSGWLFKENPSLNVVEHPVYDVWVKDCAMSFPGEE
ncbi:DUF2155 domain-containing protein [Erythrobacter longus]|uniref:DUF2155 domain-containing protein n=1 Tax=Erythrobacter longus TaxID=1044 RepID=UPI001F524B2E|nr:DUF2155 domain-containing protein [Erythrobacter longus]